MTKVKIIVTTPEKTLLKYIREESQTISSPELLTKEIFYIKDGFVRLIDDKGLQKGFPIAWCELTGASER